MKKKAVTISFGFATIVVAVIAWNVMFSSNLQIDAFDYKEENFEYYINNFSSSEFIKSTADFKEIVSETEKIWITLYGEDVTKQKPYKVFFDSNSEVLLIQGTLPRNVNGGVANMLIQRSTGEVLAVWHDK